MHPSVVVKALAVLRRIAWCSAVTSRPARSTSRSGPIMASFVSRLTLVPSRNPRSGSAARDLSIPRGGVDGNVSRSTDCADCCLIRLTRPRPIKFIAAYGRLPLGRSSFAMIILLSSASIEAVKVSCPSEAATKRALPRLSLVFKLLTLASFGLYTVPTGIENTV